MDVIAQRTAGTATVLFGAGLAVADALWLAARPVRAVSAGLVLGAVEAVGRAFPATTGALADRGQRGWAELEARVDGLLGFVIGRVLDAFLATVDLTALVCRHADLDAIAAALDVDRVVARVDLDVIVNRIDLDAVAARLDVDRVVARADLDAVVNRIDIVGIAREVIDAIDLPEIIRHSTGALTSDTVRTVRTEARQADDVVSGVVDRLLHRSRAAVAAVPAPR